MASNFSCGKERHPMISQDIQGLRPTIISSICMAPVDEAKFIAIWAAVDDERSIEGEEIISPGFAIDHTSLVSLVLLDELSHVFSYHCPLLDVLVRK